MKTYRQKTRNRGGDGGIGAGGGKDGATNSDSKAGAPEVKGPDEAKIKVRTGQYSVKSNESIEFAVFRILQEKRKTTGA